MNGDPTKYPEWYKNYLRGIMQVESSGGNPEFFMNPSTSATGMYQQMYKQVKDLPMMEGVTREGFAADTALQNKVMGLRFMDDVAGIPGELRNSRELTERFAPQFGDKWDYRPDEVAAMTYFLGRQGTINYLNHLLKGGDPEEYKVRGRNMSVPKYLSVYNTGFGGEGEEEQPQEQQVSPELQNALDIMKRDNRFGGRVIKKKNYGQNGMLVQKDPTLVPDPPEELPSDDVLARLSLGIQPAPDNQFRLTGGDAAPFRTIKEQKDVIAEQESEGDMFEVLRYLPLLGEAIDTYELGKVLTTGEDLYGQEQDPGFFTGMTAAGYIIPNVLERPLKTAWRAIKKFPAKMPKKEFRELMGPEKERVRANLIQAHREVYDPVGGLRVNVRQLPSLMSGSKLENAVGKDGMIQVSQIENLINSKDISAAEREALQDALFRTRSQAGYAAGLEPGSPLPDKIDYLNFKRAGSDVVSTRRGDATFFVDESKEYADYGVDRLGLNVRLSTSRDMALADDVGLARTNLIRTTDPELQASEYGHFGEDVIGHYRTFERPDEKGVLYISELQADPLQARGPAGKKEVSLNIGEEGPTAKQANLIKNQDKFLISHILEQEAKGADKLRFPTGETTHKIQGYGDIEAHVASTRRDLETEQGALDAMMEELDTVTGETVQSPLANRVEAMGLSGMDADKAIDYLGRVRAYRRRGGIPRDLASDPGIQYNQSVVDKFDNDALKQAYKELKAMTPEDRQLEINFHGGTIEKAAEQRAIDIKKDINSWNEQLERIKTRREHLDRVNASTQATQGIMKGYDNLPKALKKHGLDATKVTDDVGNTWWEVDIPARLGEGVGEIRAYRKGGQVSDKIRVLKKEGYPQKQAVAIALAMKQKGQL